MEIYSQLLRNYWGYSDFRPLQTDIIESVAAGRDTLGLMPTGGGKSVTFQVYSLSVKGICLVITPLIALMKDQVEKLTAKGIKALAVHSGMSPAEIKMTLDNALWGNYKFLYISPERIATERFRDYVEKMNVNLITVDEAHCISQWGYDFRPSYLQIAGLRDIFPGIPFLALTATATTRVIDDIQEKLRFRSKNVLRQSFARENLVYMVRNKEDKAGYLVETVKKAKGSGIVYVRNRKSTREISDLLSRSKIQADSYHAGYSSTVRSLKQDNWINNVTRVIVATNAFGMGIDKPDVRFVLHADPPDSIEAYFQEAGRAGRDGEKAFAVMLYNPSDKVKLKKHISTAFPEIAFIKRVYDALGNFLQVAVGFGKGQVYEFNLGVFCETFRFQHTMVFNSLRILQRQEYIEFTDEIDSPSRVYFIVSRDDLYKFQVANASFDGFIKLLLRSYTGLFTGYTAIEEQLLAKRAGIEADIVFSFLNRLKTLKIIDYIPQKITPYIIYTKERVSIERISISKENYDFRKKDYIGRIESVINYLTNTSVCRSRFLLDYFGESGTANCGFCDVCLSRKSLELTDQEFEMLSQKIRDLLQEPLLPEELLFRLGGNLEKTKRTVRWLMDNKKLIVRIDNRLEWSEKV